ncbi:MAG TPA: PIN domain-containing protein [Candidatus Saccharimonadia bacterium]|nr:PIN domain-containing protein [Candidatus Saccharimonadia bacterium]
MVITKPIRVFVDSDVIISSLISKSGAAFTLLHNTNQIELYISNFSSLELQRVAERLNIKLDVLNTVIDTRLKSVKIDLPYESVQHKFADYVRDPHDAHIVAGAKEAKAAFLVSYNIRHFNAEKLRQDFQIILLTPGLFLQYLRSL